MGVSPLGLWSLDLLLPTPVVSTLGVVLPETHSGRLSTD
jgi:hypothetical protein